MEESKTLRLTVFEFRKRFFAPNCRPSRSKVIEWITRGTRERVYLRANRLDGEYYITIGDAEAFMRATTALNDDVRREIKINASATHKASVEYLRQRGFEIP